MKSLPHLLERNRRWAEEKERNQPGFFANLAREQKPEFLWIGCSDSRVPANQIVDLSPGEIFVHRNIANLVVHSDVNCHAVLQFAVENLEVQHVIVCGHFGCGGVAAALADRPLGLIDYWLRHIQDVARKHQPFLDDLSSDEARRDALCALNVIEQVMHACRAAPVRAAWERGQRLAVHSWIYGLEDGRLQDLGMHVSSPGEIAPVYREAVAAVHARFTAGGPG